MGFCLGILSGLQGCGDPSEPTTFLQTPRDLFSSLKLNYRAINLAMVAPYDTVTLVATPRNALGEVLVDAPVSEFKSESDRIIVLPNGVIKGIGQTSANGSRIFVTMTVNGVTLSDTARIVVTNVPVPPILKSFSMQLPTGDSAFMAAPHLYDNVSKKIMARALDSSGVQIPRTIVYYQTENQDVGAFSDDWNPAFLGYSRGETMLYTSAMVYGIPMHDSLLMTVTDRRVQVLYIKDGLSVQRETTIAAGGGVFWLNFTNDSLDIVFDDPNVAAKSCCTPVGMRLSDTSGNIDPFVRDLTKPIYPPGGFITFPRLDPDIAKGRSFYQPGRYKYHSTRRPDIWGTVVVR